MMPVNLTTRKLSSPSALGTSNLPDPRTGRPCAEEEEIGKTIDSAGKMIVRARRARCDEMRLGECGRCWGWFILLFAQRVAGPLAARSSTPALRTTRHSETLTYQQKQDFI